MRRRDQPRRPSARICSCLSEFKTLAIRQGGHAPPGRVNVPSRSSQLAGFQVISTGRVWVIPEASDTPDRAECARMSDMAPRPRRTYTSEQKADAVRMDREVWSDARVV
jgi:hypothetical protein